MSLRLFPALTTVLRAGAMASPEEVLSFWIGEPATDADGMMAKVRRWYQGGPEMDAEVAARFSDAVGAALAGTLDPWADDPRGRLALIILLDQFTRNVFRGDPLTYAGDARAQRLSLEGIERGDLAGLSIEERLFFAMPLMHAEDPALQELAVAQARARLADAPAAVREVIAMGVEQAEKYRGIIARYGRFPHRNAILGRTNTPEEETFLIDWQEKMPPHGMRPARSGGASPSVGPRCRVPSRRQA